jgi:hypothetical protein
MDRYPLGSGGKRVTDVTKAKRGDLVAWGDQQNYTLADGRNVVPMVTYYIGIVTATTRDGIVKKADTMFGAPCDVRHDVGLAVMPQSELDMSKARAWLASDQNYPRRGSTPLRSMSDVRTVVRPWLLRHQD